ncbi:5-deoxy-glucuronate isomerase [Clostridium saccharobutylicum]|uniref:5-deoxy-glucuronate isomerase n=1 Tax=Clostridium saccharobutylicum TaxID=169679 RepID=UPI000983B105|nr:5-deoxy-glucuronate isomerase [Clostridium saccharobutylicum]AQS09129.1 5-deoxy-glucuronate isomerase [Clostridium saccharobutylicum]MBC2435368.1 5-deoxy-glucuronate isomerase [Clostridium saccharobutylicum]NSB87365.1 5-deoxy-glucuronate isomerase [Clostridium saccharobutylicum]NYC28509.1 5-deoxy-glucuronate isomerase [Clostridium saccharobutylicum]OOM15701.1 5-deoxy-glucuronate isomerase [Clostridium saccharobutylicum]
MVHNLDKLEHGENILCEVNGKNKEMLMDITVENLNEGEKKEYLESNKELAILLLTGKIKINWLENSREMERKSVFDEDPCCLHVPRNTRVSIEVFEKCEIIVQSTENLEDFTSKFYSPSDCRSDIFGEGTWGGTARRVVRTVFDYNNAPYSNMVMGEVITYPGKWSSYPPHYHPQPEVYFYKFDKPQGFGLCLNGEDAYRISDNSFATIIGGDVHPQTSAPGYAMYYCWMIRHLENNPWTDRIDVEEHKWLWEKDAKIWPCR